MDAVTSARREAGLELRTLVEEFERSDAAAFRRGRLLCWAVTAIATLLLLLLWMMGGELANLLPFWAILLGLVWAGHLLSGRRQRDQTRRLRELAARWVGDPVPL